MNTIMTARQRYLSSGGCTLRSAGVPMRLRTRRAVIAGTLMLVILGAPWLFWGFGTGGSVMGSLAPEDVGQIQRVVFKERCRLLFSALRAVDLRAVRQILLAKPDYVGGQSAPKGSANAVYRDGLEAGFEWRFILERAGSGPWKCTGVRRLPRLIQWRRGTDAERVAPDSRRTAPRE